MEDKRRFAREELYELVWSKPLTVLATELGVSNVGLAKICDRLDVPRPRSGYWLSVAHRKADRPSLTPCRDGVPKEVTIKSQPRRVTDVLLEVMVPKRLNQPHPITAKILAALTGGHSDAEGQPYAHDMPGCPVRVSKNLKGRAIRILDAAIRAIEARGHRVLLEKGYDRWSLSAMSGEDKVPFRIREKWGQKKHEPTKSELSSTGQYWGPRFDHFAKGELLLEIDGCSDGSVQQRWADTKRQQLEEKVGGFVVAVEFALDAVRRRREYWAAWHREREEEQRRVEDERRRADLEQKKIDCLQNMAAAWRTASMIRSFVAALEREARTPGEAEAILGWARDIADRMDPLRDAAGAIRILGSEPEGSDRH